MTKNTPSNRPFQFRTQALGLVLAIFAGSTTALAQDEYLAAGDEQSEKSSPRTGNVGAAKGRAALPKDGVQVKLDDSMTVDLHVKDEDLANVLEMLSIQSQKNIIANKDVQARVTANLYGVTFYEALDAVLSVNGYGFMEEGNFIKIYTLEELAKINAQARIKVSKVIRLNYLAAVDAAEFVKPLLSNEGQMKVNGKASQFPPIGEVPMGAEDFANSATIVVYDYEENMVQIEEMIRQLDTRPSQVLVEATILQSQINEANALGVDFSVLASSDFADFVTVPTNPADAAPLTVTNKLITGIRGGSVDGGSVTSTVGNVAAGAGGVKLGFVSGDVAVFLRMLDEVTDSTVLANPKIVTLNRMASRVLVGRKVGYLNTTSTDTATTQSVEFLDTGTQLYVRPFVTNDGLIRMELKPQVSEAAIREISNNGGAAVTIPDEITNELSTNVLVRDGQTIVLGGLFREATTNTRKQLPFLGDLPIIGRAFRGNDDNTNRNEIIFLITPQVINDATATDTGIRGKRYIENVVTGARQGTLPWSREKLTSSLNLSAENAMRDGNTSRALNLTERSLKLNSNQPDVIEMRDRLTNTRSSQYQRSFLERVFNNNSKMYVEGKDTGPVSSNFNAAPADDFQTTWTAPAIEVSSSDESNPTDWSAQPEFAQSEEAPAQSDTAQQSQPQTQAAAKPGKASKTRNSGSFLQQLMAQQRQQQEEQQNQMQSFSNAQSTDE
jgi:type IV pilus assembly protein PilQ